MFMRRTVIVLLLALPLTLQGGELLDRIVARVNAHVILQSDWDDEVRFETFMSGRKPENVGVEQRQAALDRLIDQELLREQMRTTNLKPVASEKIKKQIDDLKGEQARELPAQSWKATLSKYQLSEKVIEQHVAAELEQLQLIDMRFRPSIRVSDADVAGYYREQVVPKLPTSAPLSLDEAAPEIREILIQQKINQLLNSWLETLRSQSRIQVLSAIQSSDLQPSAQGTR